MDPCELVIQRWLYVAAACVAAASVAMLLTAGLLGSPPAAPVVGATSAGPCTNAH